MESRPRKDREKLTAMNKYKFKEAYHEKTCTIYTLTELTIGKSAWFSKLWSK